jgi:hypothetical protein
MLFVNKIAHLGILCDDAMGMYAFDTIHSDLDSTYINTLPETIIHRNVDSKIVNADIEGS